MSGTAIPSAKRHPVVLAITGASGAPYAVRLLQALVELQVPTWLIVSSHGWRLLRTESDIGDLAALREHVGSAAFDACVTVFDDNDRVQHGHGECHRPRHVAVAGGAGR